MQIKKRKEFMLQELHSIYPVYNNYDDIVGVANLKSILQLSIILILV
jgi:CBS domain containing-hemolysin-like protein